MLLKLLAPFSTEAIKRFSVASGISGLAIMGLWLTEPTVSEPQATEVWQSDDSASGLDADLLDGEVVYWQEIKFVMPEPPSYDPPDSTVTPMTPGARFNSRSRCNLPE